jgi:hypothetical protein
LNQRGWLGYLWRDVFFIKRFQPKPASPHPDRGCNAEVYCHDRFIELETIGPLALLEPGQTATHCETWELYSGLTAPPTIIGVRALLAALEI